MIGLPGRDVDIVGETVLVRNHTSSATSAFCTVRILLADSFTLPRLRNRPFTYWAYRDHGFPEGSRWCSVGKGHRSI